MKKRILSAIAAVIVIVGSFFGIDFLGDAAPPADIGDKAGPSAVISAQIQDDSQEQLGSETGSSVQAKTGDMVEDDSSNSNAATSSSAQSNSSGISDTSSYVDLTFRTEQQLDSHYKKHGIEMGFDSAEAYEDAACDVVADPDSLHKYEKEDGDSVYYLEDTNEFVVVSTDGYLRTYFYPDDGIAYFNRQ